MEGSIKSDYCKELILVFPGFTYKLPLIITLKCGAFGTLINKWPNMDFAKILPKRILSEIGQGIKHPTIFYLHEIAQALEVSLGEIMDF